MWRMRFEVGMEGKRGKDGREGMGLADFGGKNGAA